MISEGRYGLCNARQNIGGTLISQSYAMISALNLDPVEKKPLYHFYPGSKTLSFGSFGCNLKCGFCQNSGIASSKPAGNIQLSPEDAVYFAVEKNIKLISYTYNEPLINYEWVFDMSMLARKKSMQNILVTNGYIKEEPLKKLACFIDAANVDLKAFSDDFYHKNCGGSLEPVLKSIEILHKMNVHLEITNLVIDGENSDMEEFEKMIEYIAGINDEIPLHLSRYFPSHKFTAAKTKRETLFNLYDIAKTKLKYVYLGNFDGIEQESTYCKNCGFCIISRKGYDITVNCKNPRICPECGIRNNIII
ncbi:MAG: AmmeMemoRadiSam system radical SAM enzyme [Endomicrobia bacterium]|nr:AmmeMemoRadiSam system radical SAM enzyme [Endomicrobiia bacterium]